jgi:hypothetical protein
LVAQVDAELGSTEKGSFGRAVLQWLDSREDEAGEPVAETLDRYRNLAESHVIPVLGSITLGGLERELVPAAERLLRHR